jgi:hypothetical protein
MSSRHRHEAPTVPVPAGERSPAPRTSGVRAQGISTVPSRGRCASEPPDLGARIVPPGTVPLAPRIPRGLDEEAAPSAPAIRAIDPATGEAERPPPSVPPRSALTRKTNSHARPRAIVEIVIRDLRRDPRSEE